MKKKTVRKTELRASRRKSAKAVPTAVAATDTRNASPSNTLSVGYSEMPPPEILLEEADREPNYRDLAVYCDVISVLRGKGFSYREIAEWLTDRGVPVDHNEVYRVYTRSLPDYEAAMAAREAEEEAQEEAYRNR